MYLLNSVLGAMFNSLIKRTAHQSLTWQHLLPRACSSARVGTAGDWSDSQSVEHGCPAADTSILQTAEIFWTSQPSLGFGGEPSQQQKITVVQQFWCWKMACCSQGSEVGLDRLVGDYGAQSAVTNQALLGTFISESCDPSTPRPLYMIDSVPNKVAGEAHLDFLSVRDT